MAIKDLVLVATIVMLFLTLKNYIIFEYQFIIGSFVVWCILTFIRTHNKNKERRTPRAVYMTN